MIVNSGNLTTLYRAFNAAYREGFGQAAPDHGPIAMEVTSTTKEEEYGWLGQYPGMREWVGERVLRGISEHGYSVRNRKFESTVEVARDDVEDDKYGVYAPLFQEMGRAAGAHPCEMVWGLLAKGHESVCYDGQYFFDTDHPGHDGTSVANYDDNSGAGTRWYLADCSRMVKPILFQKRRDYTMVHMDSLTDENVFLRDVFAYGVDCRVNAGFGLWQLCYASRKPLTAANYEAARVALGQMKGDQGRPMGVRPTHLVVPWSLDHAARELLNAERLANGATNVYMGTATLIVTPWLED